MKRETGSYSLGEGLERVRRRDGAALTGCVEIAPQIVVQNYLFRIYKKQVKIYNTVAIRWTKPAYTL